MICIKNQKHTKKDTVCPDCLKELDDSPVFPDLNKVEPELRTLLTQLTLQNQDLYTCWKSSFANLTVLDKKLRIENVYYAFFRGDIGNSALKRTCGTIGCVNPYHHVSRFETSHITKKIRAGFNRKFKDVKDVSDAEWLRLP